MTDRPRPLNDEQTAALAAVEAAIECLRNTFPPMELGGPRIAWRRPGGGRDRVLTLVDHLARGFRPMSSVRQARDGRHILLIPAPERLAKVPAEALRIGPAAVAAWRPRERDWLLSHDPADLGKPPPGPRFDGRQLGGWIDDDFLAWAPLPDLPRPLGERRDPQAGPQTGEPE